MKQEIAHTVMSVKYLYFNQRLRVVKKGKTLYLSIVDMGANVFTNLHDVSKKDIRKIMKTYKRIDNHLRKQNKPYAAQIFSKLTPTPSRTKSADNDSVEDK